MSDMERLKTLELAVLDASVHEFPSVRAAMIRRVFEETRLALPRDEPEVLIRNAVHDALPDGHDPEECSRLQAKAVASYQARLLAQAQPSGSRE